ncbi:MAG: ABC transporter ATP-binding protein [Coriobacteriia bacterium]|nr:ABC transporter ATP-binding protein [Coriobacteriia bacterium]
MSKDKRVYDESAIAIKAEGLSKSFGKKKALDGISFTIDSPGITGLLGRNGAGKTTLMKLIAGHSIKSSGELLLWGASPLNNLSVRNRLIYSSHDVSYSGGLTLDTILKDHQSLFPTFEMVFAGRLLDYFNIDTASKYSGISQGAKSTFNFVTALSARAPLTMLDEPTLGMDVTVRKVAYEILLREYNEHPRIFLVSSHLVSEMENFLDSLILLDQSELIIHKDIDNLRQNIYRLEGAATTLSALTEGKDVIFRKDSEFKSMAIIYEEACEQIVREADEADLVLGGLSPEDLYVHLSRETKEGDLACLWQTA